MRFGRFVDLLGAPPMFTPDRSVAANNGCDNEMSARLVEGAVGAKFEREWATRAHAQRFGVAGVSRQQFSIRRLKNPCQNEKPRLVFFHWRDALLKLAD